MMKPADYLVQQFNRHKIIMLGEEHRIKENIEFVIGLIPVLYSCGVQNLGMEFGCCELQEELDSLLSGHTYDDSKAREMMFTYNAAWPMKAYTDIYYAVWEFNQKLNHESPKFRIVNLSYQYDWTKFQGRRTIKNAEKIYTKGPIEQFRAAVVEREVIKRGGKILILTGTPHAFTRYAYTVYDNLEYGFCRYIRKDFGHLLYERYGDDVMTVLLHQPFRKDGIEAAASPCRGALEKYFMERGGQAAAIDLNADELGDLMEDSDYSFGYTDFRLKNLADGYIFLKPLSQLHGSALDRRFIEKYPYRKVLEQFPDPDWHTVPQTEEEYWAYMEEFTDLKKAWAHVWKGASYGKA